MRVSTFALGSLLAVCAGTGSALAPAAFLRPVVQSSIALKTVQFRHVGSHSAPNSLAHPHCKCVVCSFTSLQMTSVAEETPAAEEAPAAEEIPAEVAALDGIGSEEEAHNVERPARASGTAKHSPKKGKGIPLAELEMGQDLEGTVKTITSYGAFLDIGAATDALLHVSRLSDDFVSNVEDIVKVGDKVAVHIVNINTEKNQVAVSMMSKEAEAKRASGGGQGGGGAGKDRPRRSGGDRAAQRAAMQSLVDKGFDTDLFVEGEVQTTLDFGAFVRFAIGDFGDELEGEIDGLVHISALAPGRVNNVNDVVKSGDKVQIRVKSVDAEAGKVSLSMITKEQEPKPRERTRRSKSQFTEEEMGPKDWKEKLEAFQENQPTFTNMPLIVDNRK